MEFDRLLAIMASSFAISIVTYYLTKGNTKEVKKKVNGDYVLELPKMYKYIGWISISIAFIFLISTCIYPDEFLLVLAALMVALFGGLGIPCLLGSKNHKLVFNNKYVTVYNWRGIKTQIHWTDIQDVKFSSLSGYLKLYGKDKVLKINYHLVGLNVFKNTLDRKTRWNTKDLGIS